MVPWDPDLNFGQGPGGGASGIVQGDRSIYLSDINRLINAIYYTPEFREMYLRRLRTLADEVLQPPGTLYNDRYFETRIDQFVAQLAPDAALDFAKWGTWGDQEDLYTAIGRLKNEFLDVRRAYLASHSDLPPSEDGSIITTTTVLDAGAPATALVPSTTNGGDQLGDTWEGGEPFDDSDWIALNTGAGYDVNDDYEPLFGYEADGAIETAIQDQMRQEDETDLEFNQSIFIRIPFAVDPADLAEWDTLALKMRYDDGFVAYINGVKVAEANAPASPAWDAGGRGAAHRYRRGAG